MYSSKKVKIRRRNRFKQQCHKDKIKPEKEAHVLDEMIEICMLGEKATLFKTFIPPPVSKDHLRLGVVDEELARIIADASEKCADEFDIPCHLREKLQTYVPLVDEVQCSKCGEYSFNFPRYLDQSVVDDLKDEVAQVTLTERDFSESSDDRGVKPLSLVKPASDSLKSRLGFRKSVSTRAKSKKAPEKSRTYSIPLKNSCLLINTPSCLFQTEERGSNPFNEDPKYAGLSFSIDVENFTPHLNYTTDKSLKCLDEDDTNAGTEIRFQIPRDLSELKGLSVLDYLLKYCQLPLKLNWIFRERFKRVREWLAVDPRVEMKDHINKAFVSQMTEKEIDEFLGLFEFDRDFLMTPEKYGCIMAACIRVFGGRLGRLNNNFWKYQASPLETIDLSHVEWKMKGLKLEPKLKKFLKLLNALAENQLHQRKFH